MKKKDAIRYAQLLLHESEHKARCASYLADIIIEGLDLDKNDLSIDEKRIFQSAGLVASHILGTHGGIDFMFSEQGEFTGVVL